MRFILAFVVFLISGCTNSAILDNYTQNTVPVAYTFSDNDPNVLALVRYEPVDGLIHVYFNKMLEHRRDDLVIFPDQMGSAYAIYVNGVGGLKLGEEKRVPVYDRWCILGEDETIYCYSMVDQGASAHHQWQIEPQSPAYEARRSVLVLVTPGDATLFRNGVPLPRSGV